MCWIGKQFGEPGDRGDELDANPDKNEATADQQHPNGSGEARGKRGESVDENAPGEHTSPAKTIEDVKVHELLIAATGAGANSAVLPYIMNQLIGTKFKIIPGYKGTNDGMLAMQRGEVGAYTSQWGVVKSQNRDWLQEKKINILVQYALEREPDLADVPTSVELSDKQEDRQVFALLASSGAVGRSLVAPPALPPERVAMLRAAFEAVMKDPKLLEEARLAGYDIKAMPGAKLQQVANSVFDIPADVVAKTAKLSTRTK